MNRGKKTDSRCGKREHAFEADEADGSTREIDDMLDHPLDIRAPWKREADVYFPYLTHLFLSDSLHLGLTEYISV
jgi:hypothetical protein